MRSSCQWQEEFGVAERNRSDGFPERLLLLPASFYYTSFKTYQAFCSYFFHLFPLAPALFIIHHIYEMSIYWINIGSVNPSRLSGFFPLKLPTWVFHFCFQSTAMADRFDCDNCKESLYGRKYIQSDDSPYCIPCYDSLFSNTCDECKELIGHDARVRGILPWSDTQLTVPKHYDYMFTY